MASNPTIIPLSASRGAQPPTPIISSPSSPFPIRAPLSSDDNDIETIASDAGSLTSDGDADAEDGFQTASETDDPTPLTPRVGMPVAQLTGDDDVTEEVFLDDEVDDDDGGGFPAVARVVLGAEDLVLTDDGEVLDEDIDDPAEIPGMVDDSKEDDLGLGEEAAEPESPPEDLGGENFVVETVDSVVSGTRVVHAIDGDGGSKAQSKKVENLNGDLVADEISGADTANYGENGVSAPQSEKDDSLDGGLDELGRSVVSDVEAKEAIEPLSTGDEVAEPLAAIAFEENAVSNGLDESYVDYEEPSGIVGVGEVADPADSVVVSDVAENTMADARDEIAEPASSVVSVTSVLVGTDLNEVPDAVSVPVLANGAEGNVAPEAGAEENDLDSENQSSPVVERGLDLKPTKSEADGSDGIGDGFTEPVSVPALANGAEENVVREAGDEEDDLDSENQSSPVVERALDFKPTKAEADGSGLAGNGLAEPVDSSVFASAVMDEAKKNGVPDAQDEKYEPSGFVKQDSPVHGTPDLKPPKREEEQKQDGEEADPIKAEESGAAEPASSLDNGMTDEVAESAAEPASHPDNPIPEGPSNLAFQENKSVEPANSFDGSVVNEVVEPAKGNGILDARDETGEPLEPSSPIIEREPDVKPTNGPDEPKQGVEADPIEKAEAGVADSAGSTQNLELSDHGSRDFGNGGHVYDADVVVGRAEQKFLVEGSAAVIPDEAEDSGHKLHVVYVSEADDSSAAIIQEIRDAKMIDDSGHASAVLKEEPVVPGPESAESGGDTVSFQEVQSQPILSEESEISETERDISETLVSVEGGNSGVVPSESSTSDSVSSVKDKSVDALSCVTDGDKEVDTKAVEEHKDGLVSDTPARIAILEESSEAAKQIINELGEGSSSTATNADLGSGDSHDCSCNADGQIASDSEEEPMHTDEEGDEKELFDSAALVELLKAATGVSSDGSVTISSADAARIFNVERPAGLGNTAPSLKPAPARSTRPNLFAPSDLAVAGEPEVTVDEEERKLHEKLESIRVKFLRLVHRLGHSPDDTVAAQVLYRLGLAEGIRRGRQTSQAFSLQNARKKALELEMDGKVDLDFSCNILVLGKTGVGKSATMNSIFGEDKSCTSAFQRATTSVKEIAGVVDGVKIRVIDTPGLSSSVMDQTSNIKILSSIQKYTKRCPPDIVLYVDRMDMQTRDFNDLPLLRSVTSALGSSIWFNAIVALTHASSAPPDGPNGNPLSYDVFVAQRSQVVQHSIRQAAGDMRLMNPVALVENHPSCRRNREGERVLPNGLSWRSQMLLLCYSSKILSEANSLLKLQDPSPRKLFGFRGRQPPLAYFLSSLLQSRSHPKLSVDQGGENDDSDVDLDDLSDDQDEEDYNDLPPFKPLRKSQLAKLTKEQRRAYFDEYDYRVKLLQKKQWKDELRRLKEMKKHGKGSQDEFGYGDMAEDLDQDNVPATVPVPLPDMVLPPSFDCDYPAYRYRFLEPTSELLTRPVLDSHGWDHDCGYDGVNLEHNLAVANRFPAGLTVQVTKDKKDFNIHLDSSIVAKHGENGSTLAGLDIQSIGKQIGYFLRSETKFKNLKKNKTAAGISVSILGETIATGLKVEDELSIGRRLSLVASTGTVRAQGDAAYGANLEASLRDKDYPISQSLSTLGLSLLKCRGDLALGANLQSQFSVGRNSKMAVRIGLNNKMSGQVTIRTSSSEHLQIALMGIIPIAVSIYRSILPGESVSY